MVSFKSIFGLAAFISAAAAAPCAVAAEADSAKVVCLDVSTKRATSSACAPIVDSATGAVTCSTEALTVERREVKDVTLGDFSPRSLRRRAQSLRQRDSNVCMAATDKTSGIVKCLQDIPVEKRSDSLCVAQIATDGTVICAAPQ